MRAAGRNGVNGAGMARGIRLPLRAFRG